MNICRKHVILEPMPYWSDGVDILRCPEHDDGEKNERAWQTWQVGTADGVSHILVSQLFKNILNMQKPAKQWVMSHFSRKYKSHCYTLCWSPLELPPKWRSTFLHRITDVLETGLVVQAQVWHDKWMAWYTAYNLNKCCQDTSNLKMG